MGSRESIGKIREQNPCATLQSIANKVGVSRERVRQILKSENKPTTHWKPKHICPTCGSEILRRNTGNFNKFCSPECRNKNIYIPVSCSECNKIFPLRAHYVIYMTNIRGREHFFCSKECQGAYAGKYYGFASHPQNSGRNKGQSKYSDALCKRIISLRQENISWGNIHKQLNIPLGTLSKLSHRGEQFKEAL